MNETVTRILCIDDHTTYLATMIDCLADLPARVDGAINGREAVDLLVAAWRTNEPYDLVTIDMYVPKEPGEQISFDENGNPVEGEKFGLNMLTDWRARYQLLPLTTPVIVYTLYPNYADCIRCIRAGAFDYVPKQDKDKKDQMELLFAQCQAALQARQGTPGKLAEWLRRNIAELTDRYGGQMAALVEKGVARDIGLPGDAIDGYVLIADANFDVVRRRIIEDRSLIWASPEIINIPNREDAGP